MWKRALLLVVLGFLCIGCLKGLFGGKATLSLDKAEYLPGEAITVTFKAPSSYPEKAWVGVIPSVVPHGDEAVNDQNDVAYQYLQKRTAGTLTFAAPEVPGDYDIRMNNSDNNGKEVASASFTVKAPPAPEGASLKLDKMEFSPGESIRVSYTTPIGFAENAWVGIIPSNIEHGSEATNDQHDVAYQYLKGSTRGALTFTAPDQPGSYDFRMNDTDADGREVGSVTFTVK
jgi:hypothetical protein